jgi:ABC-type lipopolysaccharide export system ATPase subunit
VDDGSGRVTVHDLTKQFGSARPGGAPAVSGLTFSVEPGRVTGFLGPNGSGKTTTLRMILGPVAPTSGAARINGVLPGKAGDVALYDVPAHALAGPGFAEQVVEELAGVTAPPPLWGALAVLAGWAMLASVIAWGTAGT